MELKMTEGNTQLTSIRLGINPSLLHSLAKVHFIMSSEVPEWTVWYLSHNKDWIKM